MASDTGDVVDALALALVNVIVDERVHVHERVHDHERVHRHRCLRSYVIRRC